MLSRFMTRSRLFSFRRRVPHAEYGRADAHEIIHPGGVRQEHGGVRVAALHARLAADGSTNVRAV